jgi:hypothetical protein
MLSTRMKVNNECLHIKNDEHLQTIVNNIARNVFSHKTKQAFKCLHVKNHDNFQLIVDNKTINVLNLKKSMNRCTLKIINILNKQ